MFGYAAHFGEIVSAQLDFAQGAARALGGEDFALDGFRIRHRGEQFAAFTQPQRPVQGGGFDLAAINRFEPGENGIDAREHPPPAHGAVPHRVQIAPPGVDAIAAGIA